MMDGWHVNLVSYLEVNIRVNSILKVISTQLVTKVDICCQTDNHPSHDDLSFGGVGEFLRLLAL